MAEYYILDPVSKEPVPVNFWAWVNWMETFDHRRIALDEIGSIAVSTVFLGLDHNFYGEGAPILFETLVSVNGTALEIVRYRTYQEAVEGHKLAIAQAKVTLGILMIEQEMLLTTEEAKVFLSSILDEDDQEQTTSHTKGQNDD